MSGEVFFGATLRFLLGFLLLCGAWGKLTSFAGLKRNLVESFGLSAGLAAALAPLLIAAEGLLAIVLLLDSGTDDCALLAALAMLLVFTLVVGYQFLSRDVVRCSCFGEAERPVSGYDLLRNLLLIAAIVAALLGAGGELDGRAGRALGGVGVGDDAGSGLAARLMCASLGLMLAVVSVHFHDLVALLGTPEEGA
ncbi:MauE/DoxX family redox-associated membrane protein [Rugamonas sp. CCM 8940]|uniref:MauE/DoxX family redox-associated membrane protein n=1 Tax=Rugamonas sp. CCM 8940 TaxID=2765359 RepID=UPI0018F464BD|nr:MauE/DoxX family redox-associated membrane protein [Rugamonas sp. CCM 8940]MBJ7313424.1 hypothetical protein [Rugamonas sp. CCM 8940]